MKYVPSPQDATVKSNFGAKKDNIGLWMLINYKNRKMGNNSQGGVKGKLSMGSRFASLPETQEADTDTNDKSASPDALNGNEPKIVKICKQVPEKTEKFLAKDATLDNAVETGSGVFGSSFAAKDRPTLQEISNNKLNASSRYVSASKNHSFGKGN